MHSHFFDFISFFLQKKYKVILHLAVAFQRYQTYWVWSNIWKVTKVGEKRITNWKLFFSKVIIIEVVAWSCSLKKVFLKLLQNSQENTCAEVLQQMRLSRQFQTSLFFFTKIFWAHKNAPQAKIKEQKTTKATIFCVHKTW